MEVTGVFNSSSQPYPQVLLKEVGGDYYLPIVIGRFEAAAIAMAQNRQKPARPISYDLAHAILTSAAARVIRVEITDLHESTYYAEVHLHNEEGQAHVLDARPSDAIALALRFDAPIYASADILAQAGYTRPEAQEKKNALARNADSRQPADTALDQLRRRLDQAIAEEIYEEAARLRDEIKRLERP
jgi:bifunctional DNase/RNase